MNTQEKLGSLFAILSGFLYGFIGYFGMSALKGNLSVSTMTFWRFLIASLVMFVFLIPQLKSYCLSSQNKKTLKQIFMSFMTGALFYALSTELYFLSSIYIGSGLAMVLFFIYPVIVMLLNYILYRQTITPVYYLSNAIIIVGIIFLIDFEEIAFDIIGVTLGILSAILYASYIVSSKKNELSPGASTFFVCLGCTITSLITSLSTHSLVLPPSTIVWFDLLGISIISTVIPLLLLLYSLKYISSEKASILSVLEPVFVVVFGVFLLGEVLHPRNTLGIALVLTGALLTLMSHKINIGHFRKLTEQ